MVVCLLVAIAHGLAWAQGSEPGQNPGQSSGQTSGQEPGRQLPDAPDESKKKSENKIILDDDNHQLSQQLGASRKTTWNSRIDREIL